MTQDEIVRWLLTIGQNLFTYYAVYKVVQYAYYWFKGRGKEDEFL